MKFWYDIKAAAPGCDTARVAILDEIGVWGVSAQRFIADLKAIEAPKVVLEINSPGGSVIDALAMFTALRASGKHITVKVLGIAASAASYLMLAGDHVVMPANTFAMLHNPLAGAYGHAEDLRDMADLLDKIGATLQATYAKRTGMSDEEVAALLSKDTWLTAQECLDLGLCDEVIDELKVSASFDVENLPENIRAAMAVASVEESAGKDAATEPVDKTAAPLAARFGAVQVRAMVEAAGLSTHAAAFALDASLLSAEAVQAAIANATEVLALCAMAGHADRAAGFIAARTTVDDVRTALIEALAARDEHITTTPKGKESAATPAKPAAVSTSTVWASRRQQTTV